MKLDRGFAVVTTLAVMLAAAVVPQLVVADDAHEGWTVSFEEAKTAAAKEKKTIFMEFTGSDWCPPCKELAANVLTTDKFKEEAPKHFVLTLLDNPRDKSKQTEEEIEQYKRLSAKYKVSGVPTIILADSQGRPYAKLVGYGGDTPEKYLEKLTSKAAVLEKRDELFAAAEKTKGVERAKLLDEMFDLVTGAKVDDASEKRTYVDAESALATYGDTVEEIIKLDAKDEAGLKSRYEGLARQGKIKSQLQEIQQGFKPGSPEETIASIDKLIKELKPEGETLQEVLFLKALIHFRGDKDAAKEILQTALAVDPKSTYGRRIASILKSAFPEKDDKGSSEDSSKDSVEKSPKKEPRKTTKK